MSDLYFTGDTHFGHKAMATKYRADFGFPSVEQMDEWLIDRWNQRVNPDDTVHHLGDFSFYNRTRAQAILDRLNGEIHLTLGNHDPRKLPEFASVELYREIKVEDQRLILFHFPIEDWHGIHHGTWHLHGHSHGNLPHDVRLARMDVGIDAFHSAWAPVPFDVVATVMKGRTGTAPGHHQRGAA